MTPEQKVHWMIVHRKKEGIEAALDEAKVREEPVRVLNEVLLPAMKEVGDKFGAGELILPFVLQSAEVMKKAVKHLEQFLERAKATTKGRVVLATVYGDVHDIGKSLVNTILSNNGYTVYDLGKQGAGEHDRREGDRGERRRDWLVGAAGLDVEADAALRAGARSPRHDAARAHRRRGDQSPLRTRALFVEGERTYGPGVFYCKDAFEGLETMDRLPGHRDARVVHLEADRRRVERQIPEHERRQGYSSGTAGGQRSDVTADNPGAECAILRHAHAHRHSARRNLRAARSRRALSPQWGGRGSGPEFDKMVKEEFEPTLARSRNQQSVMAGSSRARLRLLPGADEWQ
jgi:5-methyltetrahydrofolate--homocysteine methyltransferase